MNGCEFCGYANRTAGKTLHIVEETEPRIFINMQGSGYIQIFDEEYPGFVDGFYVNYCPMCGARLRSGYVGGEPPKEDEHELSAVHCDRILPRAGRCKSWCDGR